MTALRRRWWVIVTAVVVAGSAAWITRDATSTSASSSAEPSTGYGVTILMWNPGAQLVGPENPLMDPATLARLVKLPNVAAIASQIMYYQGDPVQLNSQVEAAVDPATGFLAITGIGKDPGSAETVANAFSHGLITYLAQLQTRQIDQQRQLYLQQLSALIAGGAKPEVIRSVRSRLATLSINRTTPIPLTELQRQEATPLADGTGVVASPSDGSDVSRSLMLRMILACLFGLLVGIVLALVLERSDTTIRSARRAEEAFGLPVLAEVPAIPRRRRHKVVTAAYPYSRVATAFRILCIGTRRWISSAEVLGAKTILVTSSEARDGKTTVAANLAATYAEEGSRVLVVSCDLRRPDIHRVFGVPERPGLVDLLRSINSGPGSESAVDIAPFLKPCSVVRVAVLPSGTTPQQPGELLGSVTMRALLDRARRITDVIILDCAPLVAASDVVPLLPQVDGVLLVARVGKTHRDVAASAAADLERIGATQVGVVLNDAREFSFPLAKRRMYRPTRKMRRAAKKGSPTEVLQPWIPEPVVEEPIPEPLVEEAMVDVIAIPEFEDEVPETAVPAKPVEPSPTPSPAAVDDLARQLAAIRARLEGSQLEPADPSGSADEATNGSGPLSPRVGSDR